jgi:Divergent InlB B-repeat domain
VFAGTDSVVDVFSIGTDGGLTIVNSYTIAGFIPATMVVHATGSWLYVYGNAGLGSYASTIEQFTVGASGTLTDNGPFTLQNFSTPTFTLVGDNLGTFLYAFYGQIGGGTAGGLIDSLAVNSVNGSLSVASNFNNVLGNTSYDLAVASTSNYLYSTAYSYSIADGVLTLLDTFMPPSTNVAPSLVASPIGPYLFETGESLQQTVFLTSQAIGSDGTLTNAPGSPYDVVFVAMAVTGVAPVPTEAILRPDVTSVAISNVVVGETGSGMVGITNWGYSPLTVSNVSVSGDPSLSQTNTCTAPVPPMGTCQVTINFVPTSAGTFNGTLTLASNAPTETVAITATSQNPSPNPVIIPSQQVTVPDAALGSSSTMTIELENYTGATAPLTVSGMTWSGSNPGDFSETNNCTAPIAVGDFCSINITFTPQALGNRAAILNITTNWPVPGGLVAATVSGNGVATVTKYSISVAANGPGTVTQNPTGTSLANNTSITLTATPNANSSFVNWGGVCSGDFGTTCTFLLTANTAATANFVANVTLTTMVVGPGTITQSPTGTSFPANSEVVLTAFPNAGAQFVSWTSSSGCFPATMATECIVTLNANTTVTATFSGPQVSLTTSVVGPGMIQQTPSGTSFNSGTTIMLTAVPGANATFTSWSGSNACVGAGSGGSNPVCTFAITANTSVIATFAAAPTVTPSEPSQTGGAGSAFTFQINESGFSANPTLTATCSIPAGGCSISGTTLTVTTTARPSSATHESSSTRNTPRLVQLRLPIGPFGFALILVAGIFLVITAPRARRIIGAGALVGGLALLAACSTGDGGGTPPASGTPAGTYPVTVTATAGTQTATTTVSVTVQ